MLQPLLRDRPGPPIGALHVGAVHKRLRLQYVVGTITRAQFKANRGRVNRTLEDTVGLLAAAQPPTCFNAFEAPFVRRHCSEVTQGNDTSAKFNTLGCEASATRPIVS